MKLLEAQAFAEVDVAGHAAKHSLCGIVLGCADLLLLTPVAVLLSQSTHVLGNVGSWFSSTNTSLGNRLPGVVLADGVTLAQSA